MAIGGMIAYKKIEIKIKLLGDILSILSIGAIIAAIKILHSNSIFPSFWALVPTLSSAFIILAGNNTFVNKFILGNKMFVFIGKISYPLYLWHWPLLVFSRMFYP
jgi:peptidoglycan/LPS O-acetylase OafA/YrhL